MINLNNPDHKNILIGLTIGISVTLTLQSFFSRLFPTKSSNEPNYKIANGLADLVGNTPLLEIPSLSRLTKRRILAKAEFLSPGGSPKDRVALNIIRHFEAIGALKPGGTIYEGTVGSTGISIALLSNSLGYHAKIFMPDDVSSEKADLLILMGAEVEKVRPASIVDQDQFVNMAKNMSASKEGSVFADQFENEANWRAHFEGTGPEIWEQTGGKVAAFVTGAGTGGTISGIAIALKQRNPAVKIVLADPQGSGLFNKIKHNTMYSHTEKEGSRRRHQIDSIIEGIGINRLTRNFEVGRKLIDDAIKVTDEEAIAMSRHLLKSDGIFIGSSSAVNVVAAVKTALRMPESSSVVTLLCDSGTRGLSKFWNDAWLRKQKYRISDDISFVLN
ncbi:Cysteine synthase 2 [Neolecta irregularis DAH-3]|uniref:cysteine synthase n=1 Tax=Neolecta irregularis (strain DAH-3) TaxID=1198029 RepID=A0A1U7LP49_NEOID|nr:Cysteine synthase 2 [Neolecta irregularis DAH-3]|eukprot:OLL24424.1 Cysteine synthase 2 [Neolecta irregularis DAH-3]